MLSKYLVDERIYLGRKLVLFNCQITNANVLYFYGELQYVMMASNFIESLAFCGHLYKLRELHIQNNRISMWCELNHLLSCKHLFQLSLRGNPISMDEDFELKVAAIVPQVCVLDGAVITDAYKKTGSRLLQSTAGFITDGSNLVQASAMQVLAHCEDIPGVPITCVLRAIQQLLAVLPPEDLQLIFDYISVRYRSMI